MSQKQEFESRTFFSYSEKAVFDTSRCEVPKGHRDFGSTSRVMFADN